MGDIDQFEAVDVGAPFKLMQERSPMDVAIMKQIVRQKDLQLRGAVHDIIDNRIDAALQRIETQPADRVARSASAALPESAIQETETPVNDIVADWKDRTPEARSRTLIIAQLNADRKAINAGIHATLAARGELGRRPLRCLCSIKSPIPAMRSIKQRPGSREWWLNAVTATRMWWPLTVTAAR